MKTNLLSLVLLLACAGCNTTPDPSPAVGVVALRLTNSAVLLGPSASASLRKTPLRMPSDGNVLWSTPAMATSTVSMGPIATGERLYLSVQYNNVNLPNYLWPSGGEYIQAELLVDGKLVASVLLNAESFNTPANYFPVDATRMHLVREVAVTL